MLPHSNTSTLQSVVMQEKWLVITLCLYITTRNNIDNIPVSWPSSLELSSSVIDIPFCLDHLFPCLRLRRIDPLPPVSELLNHHIDDQTFYEPYINISQKKRNRNHQSNTDWRTIITIKRLNKGKRRKEDCNSFKRVDYQLIQTHSKDYIKKGRWARFNLEIGIHL